MTENEAIDIAIHCLGVQAEEEVCEECTVYGGSGIICKEVAIVAVSALKEVQQYRKVGTVEEFRKAVEKQKPKKPEEIDKEYGYFICGNCGTAIYASDEHYCLNCGQKIQWDENLEGMEENETD